MNPIARCPHCHQDTLVIICGGEDPSGHCTNRFCNGFFVTLPMSQYTALTVDQLARYQSGQSQPSPSKLDPLVLDAKVEAVAQRNAARQAARVAGERLFG